MRKLILAMFVFGVASVAGYKEGRCYYQYPKCTSGDQIVVLYRCPAPNKHTLLCQPCFETKHRKQARRAATLSGVSAYAQMQDMLATAMEEAGVPYYQGRNRRLLAQHKLLRERLPTTQRS